MLVVLYMGFVRIGEQAARRQRREGSPDRKRSKGTRQNRGRKTRAKNEPDESCLLCIVQGRCRCLVHSMASPLEEARRENRGEGKTEVSKRATSPFFQFPPFLPYTSFPPLSPSHPLPAMPSIYLYVPNLIVPTLLLLLLPFFCPTTFWSPPPVFELNSLPPIGKATSESLAPQRPVTTCPPTPTPLQLCTSWLISLMPPMDMRRDISINVNLEKTSCNLCPSLRHRAGFLFVPLPFPWSSILTLYNWNALLLALARQLLQVPSSEPYSICWSIDALPPPSSAISPPSYHNIPASHKRSLHWILPAIIFTCIGKKKARHRPPKKTLPSPSSKASSPVSSLLSGQESHKKVNNAILALYYHNKVYLLVSRRETSPKPQICDSRSFHPLCGK